MLLTFNDMCPSIFTVYLTIFVVGDSSAGPFLSRMRHSGSVRRGARPESEVVGLKIDLVEKFLGSIKIGKS